MIPVILASGSPRRRALLQQIQLPFTVVSPDVDESAEPMPPDALRGSPEYASLGLGRRGGGDYRSRARLVDRLVV